MFEIAKRLMMARELQFEEGNINLLGERIQFIPTEMLVNMLHESDNFWKECYLQYESTKKATQNWFKLVSSKKNLKNDELIRWQINVFGLAGWGKFKFNLTELKSGKASFIVDDSSFGSIFLKLYGKQKYPVCNIIRGGIAGGVNVLNNVHDSEVAEIKCIVQGEPKCEMIVKPRKEFFTAKGEIIRKQINLDKEF